MEQPNGEEKGTRKDLLTWLKNIVKLNLHNYHFGKVSNASKK